jgi:hypothetical protein
LLFAFSDKNEFQNIDALVLIASSGELLEIEVWLMKIMHTYRYSDRSSSILIFMEEVYSKHTSTGLQVSR